MTRALYYAYEYTKRIVNNARCGYFLADFFVPFLFFGRTYRQACKAGQKIPTPTGRRDENGQTRRKKRRTKRTKRTTKALPAAKRRRADLLYRRAKTSLEIEFQSTQRNQI